MCIVNGLNESCAKKFKIILWDNKSVNTVFDQIGSQQRARHSQFGWFSRHLSREHWPCSPPQMLMVESSSSRGLTLFSRPGCDPGHWTVDQHQRCDGSLLSVGNKTLMWSHCVNIKRNICDTIMIETYWFDSDVASVYMKMECFLKMSDKNYFKDWLCEQQLSSSVSFISMKNDAD